jgi:hypothetical protein
VNTPTEAAWEWIESVWSEATGGWLATTVIDTSVVECGSAATVVALLGKPRR